MDNLGGTLAIILLDTAYMLVEAGKEAAPENATALVARAMFPNADIAELVEREMEILPRA